MCSATEAGLLQHNSGIISIQKLSVMDDAKCCLKCQTSSRIHQKKSLVLPLLLCPRSIIHPYSTEQHGELVGLACTQCFTQDDAHMFCCDSTEATNLFITCHDKNAFLMLE